MGTRDRSAVVLNGLQFNALTLGVIASEAAGDAARAGGYRLRPEDAQRVTRAISEAVFVMAAMIADWTQAEQIAAAASDLGAQVVHEVLGPPAPGMVQ